MKKILCMLTALICAFSIVSCNNGGGTEDGGNEGGPNIEIGNPIEDVVAASSPTKIVTKVTYIYPDGDARYGADLNGDYSLEIDGNDAIFRYDYNTFATVEEGADSWIKTVAGAVYYKDGKVSVTEGEEWDAIPAMPVNRKFELLKNHFKTYVKSEDEKTLTATITGSNIEGVLGYEISAIGDISFVLTTDGIYMRSITISYTSLEGAAVTIDTSYSYNDITLDFPSAE